MTLRTRARETSNLFMTYALPLLEYNDIESCVIKGLLSSTAVGCA